jgi:hypothetical protein
MVSNPTRILQAFPSGMPSLHLNGIESTPAAFIRMLKGENFGKQLDRLQRSLARDEQLNWTA